MFFINRTVDLSFFVDMILNFYLGFFDDKHGKWVYDLYVIRKTYLKSWFAIDIISIIPFDVIGLITSAEQVKRLKVGWRRCKLDPDLVEITPGFSKFVL